MTLRTGRSDGPGDGLSCDVSLELTLASRFVRDLELEHRLEQRPGKNKKVSYLKKSFSVSSFLGTESRKNQIPGKGDHVAWPPEQTNKHCDREV